MTDCLFCRIVRGEIPATRVYEDDEMLAFKDIHPKAAVHLLLIPKKHIATLADAGADDAPLLGRLLARAPQLAREHGAGEGFRTIINTGRDGGQEVYHLHLHILGGQAMPALIKY
ncbi:MAG: histidine triad nucleotide-binding protein [Candidatus Dactylopiibacterium sp.]|nr:histidine triad nucleotide-binding protein [Candidatus Dactylopiibacterium sp.]